MSLHLVEGAVIADRFCLVQMLGRGGMGEVWLARHAALGVLCAVKFINAEAAASPDLLRRFKLEAKAAAEIGSAHVVRILDTGVCDGRPYIAMEYLEGEDLRTRLARVRVIDARGTTAIVTQVARALGQARAAGIVHRDLKPANLFFCREGDREIVKVVDFGVAKRVDRSAGIKTADGALIGTLFYMSPEQAQRNRVVDHRADLWALAVIAFRCLTGKLPFKSASPVEVLMQIIAGPIPVPSLIAPVPIGFDTWWARAASRDPDHRFQSAKELAESLQMALGLSGTPDPEEPPPTLRLPLQTSTLPIEESRRPPPLPLHAASPAALPPSPARAPAASQSDTPSPHVAPIASVVHATAKGLARARIAAAIALMALGGVAAWYVGPRPAASVIRAQASPDPGAPNVPLAIVATVVAVTAADTPSVTPSPSSAPSATARPRSVAQLPAATPSAPSARPYIKPPAAPVKFLPPSEPTFDPGI